MIVRIGATYDSDICMIKDVIIHNWPATIPDEISRKLAEDIDPLPRMERSPDPTDDFLLALSEAGKADYLVTGDKSGLLALGRHKATRINSAKDFAVLFA
jgi:predicted nucleic acid-binding protein